MTVNFTTADNSAAAPADYTTASGALTFAPGVTSRSVTVVVNGDATFEQNEAFFVNLSGAQAAGLADSQGTGTITNDDVAAPWQNPANRLDVLANGNVFPNDALAVINALNDPAFQKFPMLPPSVGNTPPPYIDVNGDNNLTNFDALLVINEINNPSGTFAAQQAAQLAAQQLAIGLAFSRASAALQDDAPDAIRGLALQEAAQIRDAELESILNDLAESG